VPDRESAVIWSDWIRDIDEYSLCEARGDSVKGSVYFGEWEGQKDEIRFIDNSNYVQDL
jgi:hypothetical protein